MKYLMFAASILISLFLAGCFLINGEPNGTDNKTSALAGFTLPSNWVGNFAIGVNSDSVFIFPSRLSRMRAEMHRYGFQSSQLSVVNPLAVGEAPSRAILNCVSGNRAIYTEGQSYFEVSIVGNSAAISQPRGLPANGFHLDCQPVPATSIRGCGGDVLKQIPLDENDGVLQVCKDVAKQTVIVARSNNLLKLTGSDDLSFGGNEQLEVARSINTGTYYLFSTSFPNRPVYKIDLKSRNLSKFADAPFDIALERMGGGSGFQKFSLFPAKRGFWIFTNWEIKFLYDGRADVILEGAIAEPALSHDGSSLFSMRRNQKGDAELIQIFSEE